MLAFRAISRFTTRQFCAAAAALPKGDPKPQVHNTGHFINNEFVMSQSGKTFKTINPATEEVIAEIAEGGKSEIDAAVKSAQDAFRFGSPWRTMDPSVRRDLILKLAQLIERDSLHIASLEAADVGQPFMMSLGLAVNMSVEFFKYFAGYVGKHHGKTIPVDGDYTCFTRNEPVGVVGAITPWNVPFIMAASKLAPALASGCTVVLKTAEKTPLSALHLAALIKEAGFPPGVVNIVNGFGATAGAALASHPGVDKVSFTGSTVTGQAVAAAAARSNLKRVTLELGGKSPNIVFDDVSVPDSVGMAHEAVFVNQGQVCIAGSRLFVHERIHKDFVEASVEAAKTRVLGNPFEPTTQQGPQVDDVQMNRVLDFIERGKSEGAKMLVGGKRKQTDKGYYIEPTVFSDVGDNMAIARQEIFGPVMQIMKFRSVDEVIARANDTSYGLAAGVHTRRLDTAMHVASGLRAGMVWVNCYMMMNPGVPFGGFKMSGYGREGCEEALKSYTEVKCVTMKVPQKNS